MDYGVAILQCGSMMRTTDYIFANELQTTFSRMSYTFANELHTTPSRSIAFSRSSHSFANELHFRE